MPSTRSPIGTDDAPVFKMQGFTSSTKDHQAKAAMDL